MKTKKSRNGFLIVISCLMAVIMALSACMICRSSYIEVKDAEDNVIVSDFIPYTERAHVDFEDSDIYNTMVQNSIGDITRLCVIRSQMETGGVYDSTKKVDIVDFARRYDNITGTRQSVYYKLDDLIKWGNYGFDYQIVTGSEAELDNYFYELQDDVANMKVTDTEHLDNGYFEYDGDSDEDNDDPEATTQTMRVLVSRYKSCENKDLIDYALNREEYEQLVENLCQSATELFNNYSEYEELTDRYDFTNTNVRYCYQIVKNGKSVRYTNLGSAITAGMSNDDVTKVFTAYGRYVCFNPDKLQIAATMGNISPVFMKQCVNTYAYTFTDGSRIWLGIDGSYPADDIYREASALYNQADDVLPMAYIALIVSLIIYILALILMTVNAGRAVVIDEEGHKHKTVINKKVDSIPIELLILITVVVMGLLGVMSCNIVASVYESLLDTTAYLPYVIIGISALVINIAFITLYLIYVRKIKGKKCYEGSLIVLLIHRIRKAACDIYDNGSIISRTWLPYLIFLMVNLILVMLGVVGIAVAFALDMCIGVWIYRERKERGGIIDGIEQISAGDVKHQVDVSRMHGDNLALGKAVNNIGDGIRRAVETSMKDEKMKADLITNVSHDIKTPLTSIISYIDLLKRENIQDEKVRGYIDVLDSKSQRLKALTDDLVEASKISSGAVVLNKEKINFVELINQSLGEFQEKFDSKGLKFITGMPDSPVYIQADSRGMYRIIENLYNNICKYALENTRVYVNMEIQDGRAVLCIKNISADPLNISSEELMERFTRGDVSRKTEGSGLGLSIAKNLTEAQGGSFALELDGDLFKVIIGFSIM